MSIMQNVVKKLFSVIHVIPDKVMLWMGGSRSNELGEYAGGIESGSQQSLNSAMGGLSGGASSMAFRSQGLFQGQGGVVHNTSQLSEGAESVGKETKVNDQQAKTGTNSEQDHDVENVTLQNNGFGSHNSDLSHDKVPESHKTSPKHPSEPSSRTELNSPTTNDVDFKGREAQKIEENKKIFNDQN